MEGNNKTALTITAKLCILLAEFTNFLIGYAMYFVMYDTDEEKAMWFRYGARINIILLFLFIIIAICGFISVFFHIVR